jgi:hypothetical protein
MMNKANAGAPSKWYRYGTRHKAGAGYTCREAGHTRGNISMKEQKSGHTPYVFVAPDGYACESADGAFKPSASASSGV